MGYLDLQLQQQQNGADLTAFVMCPSGNHSYQVAPPSGALEWQAEWRRQFLAHHDKASASVTADAVNNFAAGLMHAMAEWLALPECLPLRQALEDHPSLPLRLRFTGAGAPSLERLPWELVMPDRPVWRLHSYRNDRPTIHSKRPRRPRLLVVVGADEHLDRNRELQRLEDLSCKGRIELCRLEGGTCTLTAIRKALLEPTGWDVLVFMGHSELDANGGGRLFLGDETWVAASFFQSELQVAATNGLSLSLFNSCSGIDLARSSIEAGIHWALCFREPVPNHAASHFFCKLLELLESGQDLFSAIHLARGSLSTDSNCAGSDLLLSLLASYNAKPFLLPLRKRKQLLLRLEKSSRLQAVAAATLVFIAAVVEINPASSLGTYMLDRRLYVQRLWRSSTGQTGPRAVPLPILVLDKRSAYEIGAASTPGRISRDLLAKLLERIPVRNVPKLGLDLVLDEPGPFTARLANVIRRQQRALLFAGFFSETVEAKAAGQVSLPLPELRNAGLQARNLAVGTPSLSGASKWVPLQLWTPVSRSNFAGALATDQAAFIPVDSVIDWSIDWNSLLRRVELNELSSLQAEVLVVGTDGSLDRDGDDLFTSPGAMDPSLSTIWLGSESKIPGVVVQAVLAQSLSINHWLTPVSQTVTTALAAGLGVLLAAFNTKWRQRLVVVGVIILLTLPLSWQIATTERLLVPLLLPLTALCFTALLRRD